MAAQLQGQSIRTTAVLVLLLHEETTQAIHTDLPQEVGTVRLLEIEMIDEEEEEAEACREVGADLGVRSGGAGVEVHLGEDWEVQDDRVRHIAKQIMARSETCAKNNDKSAKLGTCLERSLLRITPSLLKTHTALCRKAEDRLVSVYTHLYLNGDVNAHQSNFHQYKCQNMPLNKTRLC